jgi:hypothetical protein
MAARAQEISQEAGSRMAAAMKDVINAAAGIADFAVESARDLAQYMVRRGQMTQEEADKLIREAEAAQAGRPARPKPPTPASIERIPTPAATQRAIAPASPAPRTSAPAAVPAPTPASTPAIKAVPKASVAKPAAPPRKAASHKPAAKPAKKAAAKPAAKRPAKAAAKKGKSGKKR